MSGIGLVNRGIRVLHVDDPFGHEGRAGSVLPEQKAEIFLRHGKGGLDGKPPVLPEGADKSDEFPDERGLQKRFPAAEGHAPVRRLEIEIVDFQPLIELC